MSGVGKVGDVMDVREVGEVGEVRRKEIHAITLHKNTHVSVSLLGC